MNINQFRFLSDSNNIYIICYYYHLQVRMGLMWQSGNVAKWRKALNEVTALLARGYGFVPASLWLVLCVEMVVNNLGFCRAYDGRQRFYVCLPNPTNRFKAI